MYQAGIKTIKLYENNGIDFFHYNPLNKQDITHLETSGAIITIDNLQQPKLKNKISFSDSGKIQFKYELSFLIFDYSIDSIIALEQIMSSIYGWCMDIEFYDGTHKFYSTPIFCRNGNTDPSKEMIFEVEMTNAVLTTRIPYDYTPGVSELIAYRADTTKLTADNSIYTADYAL